MCLTLVKPEMIVGSCDRLSAVSQTRPMEHSTDLCIWINVLLLISELICSHGNSSASVGDASRFDCRPAGSLGCGKHRPQG